MLLNVLKRYVFDFDYLHHCFFILTLYQLRSNHIKVLNLVGYRIGSSGASYISDSIKHNTTLTTLDLSLNNIGSSGASYISDSIKHNTTLTELSLSWNNIGSSGAS